MNITAFRFEDKAFEWKLEELLLRRLTLLVGASGVGKTQILRALLGLKEIAMGRSLNGAAWYVEFEASEGLKYVWEGEFENKGISIFIDEDSEEDNSDKNKPTIIFEKLILNKKLIVDRKKDKIIFNGKPTLKLSQQESILSLLKEEDKIKPANEGLRKLQLSDQSDSVNAARGFSFSFLNANKLLKKYNSIEKIRESDLDTTLKLYFTSKTDKKTFSQIKNRFIDIFPQIEDIKVAPIETKEKDVPYDFLRDYPFIQIKERNVKHWISQNRISSGMFRTLMQLSDLYLSSEGAIFLIDEFENSLGINCINELTSDILISKRKLQFVLTSHHPYIIDAIPYDNWKLVTRNTGIIKTHDISKYNFGKSKHSAFMQLLQLEEYQTGIDKK